MSRIYRTRLSSYIVLSICIGITPAIALVFALRGDRDAMWVVAVGLAALLFTYFGFRASGSPLRLIPLHTAVYSLVSARSSFPRLMDRTW
jgi:hypothetical protein